MDVLTSLIICVMLFMALIWYKQTRKQSLRLPPGPWPLPFVGNIFAINTRKIHLTFYDLSLKYGGLFRVSLLGEEIYVINDINMARKAFLGEEYADIFADKQNTFFCKYLLFGVDVALGRANKVTYALRKMLHKGLKVFGDGVARFELQVSEELDRLVMEFNAQTGKDFDMRLSLKTSFANWMSTLATGQKAKGYDSKIIWEFNESSITLGAAGTHALLTRMPIFRFLPGYLGRVYRDCVNNRDRVLRRFFYSNDNESSVIREKAGGLVGELLKMQREVNLRAGYEMVSDLRGLILDIFFAGTDTTYTALVNSFALLLKYPECKKKIRAEVDTIIGNSRQPSLDDRRYMPYTEAFVLEVHRYTSEVPLTAPHVSERRGF